MRSNIQQIGWGPSSHPPPNQGLFITTKRLNAFSNCQTTHYVSEGENVFKGQIEYNVNGADSHDHVSVELQRGFVLLEYLFLALGAGLAFLGLSGHISN